jgi:SAM-dependent methyltransferase
MGESPTATSDLLGTLTDDQVGHLARLLDRCRFWYAESGTAALSAEAQLKLLLIGMLRAAAATDRTRPGEPFHLSCLPLAATLGDRRQPATAYRVRLVETLLAPHELSALLAGALPDDADSPLGSVRAEIGGQEAVRLTYQESAETAALLTLLPIYERKSSAAFHATLKALCDLYGLRKDDFDRVANEELYLAHMNGARNDKQRMLDHVRPGHIAEVGPGGGIVLDLLEEAYPGSTILGVDASAMVIEALRRRRAAEGRRWSVRHADAFRLPEIVGEGALDTVVYCSVLHEIYSYVEHPGDGGAPPARFRLESVRDLLRASYRALKPGGRLVIRDGVMPEPAVREIEFLASDAAEFFALFAAQFEGRAVRFERAGERRIRLDSADAMEFLYTYIWGPESFPYEVREQYGVLRYAEYRDAVLTWLGADGGPAPVAIPLPPEQASYVQGGYRRGLAGRVRLTDADGRDVDLPPSNALWVFEKPAR